MPNNITNLDEASAATQEMFTDNEQLSLADVPPVNEENPPTETNEPIEEDTPTEDNSQPTADTEDNTQAEPELAENPTELEQAAQTAEVAAQVASQKDNQLRQAMSENEILKQQNQQLQATIDEMSRRNAENIARDALAPPTLDINSLAFADEEAQKAAMAKYAEDMTAYNRQQIMKEMSPALEFAKKGMYDAEKADVVAALSQIPELANIQQMLPQLDRIIANNKWLSSDDMPMEEKYINAYAMARGIDTINNPPAPSEAAKKPTTEELMELYNSDPAFQELVEKQRLEAVKQSQQVPPFSASSGAVNAALNIQEKPQTLEEASRRTREMFGNM